MASQVRVEDSKTITWMLLLLLLCFACRLFCVHTTRRDEKTRGKCKTQRAQVKKEKIDGKLHDYAYAHIDAAQEGKHQDQDD